MFSPRYLVILGFVAAASSASEETINSTLNNETDLNNTSLPIEDDDDDDWLSFFIFSDFLAPLWELLPKFEDHPTNLRDGEFQVILQVKDFKKDELKVKVEGSFMSVKGSHVLTTEGEEVVSNNFIHTYTLPANASASDVTANLTSDGYLVITAPVNESADRTQDTDREVPIIKTGIPYKKEETPEFTALESFTFPEEEQSEPMIPSELEEKSEKENEIPHGYEV